MGCIESNEPSAQIRDEASANEINTDTPFVIRIANADVFNLLMQLKRIYSDFYKLEVLLPAAQIPITLKQTESLQSVLEYYGSVAGAEIASEMSDYSSGATMILGLSGILME